MCESLNIQSIYGFMYEKEKRACMHACMHAGLERHKYERGGCRSCCMHAAAEGFSAAAVKEGSGLDYCMHAYCLNACVDEHLLHANAPCMLSIHLKCMHASLHACMHACMYACIYACMHACMHFKLFWGLVAVLCPQRSSR